MVGHENIIVEKEKAVCISYKWEHQEKINRLTWDKNLCDRQMLIDFIKVANQTDEMIAHNGTDLTLNVRTRCILLRVCFPNYKTLEYI
jgi:hypothetical protein